MSSDAAGELRYEHRRRRERLEQPAVGPQVRRSSDAIQVDRLQQGRAVTLRGPSPLREGAASNARDAAPQR